MRHIDVAQRDGKIGCWPLLWVVERLLAIVQATIATAKASELPESKTGPHGAAAAAAAAVDANATDGVAEGAEVDMGGQGLVEAVFKGMFQETFQEVVPVRNHKAGRLSMILLAHTSMCVFSCHVVFALWDWACQAVWTKT